MPIVIAYNVVCLITMALVSTMLGSGLLEFHFLILSALGTCQIFQVIVMAGLVGRSVLAGICCASLLGLAAIVAVTPLDQWMTFDANRSVLMLPFAVCVCASPLLGARFVWGWQLIEGATTTVPFRRLRTEDFFLLTASVAAIFVLLLQSVSPRDAPQGLRIAPLGWIFMFVMAGVNIPIFGIVNLYFRRGLDHWAAFLLLLGLYLPHHLFLAMLNGFRESWMILGAPMCALGSLLGLMAYKVGGFRLIRFEHGRQEADELSEVDSQYINRARRSARVSTLLLLIATVAAVTIYSAVDRYVGQDMPSQAHAD